jgi:copper homeostasis protein
MNFKLEICSDTIESALIAQKAGADRIELCTALAEGGTTPSYASILVSKEQLEIPVHVLVRPRRGDFLYSNDEYELMKREIIFCRQLNIDGVVFGILNEDGSIDVDRTMRLVDLSWPMSVTFHRAFDLCRDPVKSLDDIIHCGVQRLLTSGQKNTAEEGSLLIHELVKMSEGRIIIMPGSGLSDTNITSVAEKTGANEFHLSAGKEIVGMMQFRKEGINMGGTSNISEYNRKIADKEKINKIRRLLSQTEIHTS